MKVEKLKVYKSVSLKFVFFTLFTVEINGVETNCVGDFMRGVIYVHWHEGGRRYLLMDHFDNMEKIDKCGGGDICIFLERHLEKAPRGRPGEKTRLPTETCNGAE